MKITDNAKQALNQIFEESGVDGLLVEIKETCCGKSPVFAIAKFDENDIVEDVDGVKIVIPDDAREDVENVVIELADGELVVMNAVCGCGEGGCGGGGCCSH